MGNDDMYDNTPVITNWEELSQCMFAKKLWVHPSDVNIEKEYEKGDFLRVWCVHDGCWCSEEIGAENCCIYNDHENE